MSSSKTAIVVLSDPKGGEEALGRLFNALAATYDFKQKRQEVQLLFQGTGTRWAGLLGKADHPAHALYKAVEDKVAGVSTACSVVFGAREDAERNGFSLLASNPVPDTPGLPSLESYASQGYTILTF
ncbi:MAG TPA: DsrE family protein [Vicinamibacterales bacterium]|nr:DsrE family protein [Vicinamibacterales bacterium]